MTSTPRIPQDLPYDEVAQTVDRAPPPCGRSLNGAAALRIDPEGEFDTAVSVAVHDGRITRIYGMRNPEKLAEPHRLAVLAR